MIASDCRLPPHCVRSVLGGNMGDERHQGRTEDGESMRRSVLERVVRAALSAALCCGWAVGCRCKPTPSGRDAAPADARRDAALPDAGQDLPEPMTAAE